MANEFLNLNEVFSQINFHKVIDLPKEYEVHDFSKGYTNLKSSEYSVGKFNERRPTMYNTEIFGTNEENRREIHMGIDIGAPVGSPIYLFYPGKIFCAAIHSQQGNYGGTIITEHVITDVKIWALYGHLSRSSVERALGLKKLDAGETIGWIGNQIENGGWAPHLHFQLSVQEPAKCDMQGVVSLKDHQESLKTFLDPRIVLGNIY